MDNLKIVISCYKKDIFLTRICVASIRYFYPYIPIYIIKDYILGNFPTWDLEKFYNVKILDLGIKKYGWATAKMHVLFSGGILGKKLLVLDSDTVFIGRVIDEIRKYLNNFDFIVSPEYKSKPGTWGFNTYYYNYQWFKKLYPKFKFPGYTINTGQMFVTPGALKMSDVSRFLSFDNFPFWQKENNSKFHSRDQAVLNVILPLKNSLKEIKLTAIPFYWWAKDVIVTSRITLDDIKRGRHPRIVHWAGKSGKNLGIRAMSRPDILSFFENYYYSNIPFGKTIKVIRNLVRSM